MYFIITRLLIAWRDLWPSGLLIGVVPAGWRERRQEVADWAVTMGLKSINQTFKLLKIIVGSRLGVGNCILGLGGAQFNMYGCEWSKESANWILSWKIGYCKRAQNMVMFSELLLPHRTPQAVSCVFIYCAQGFFLLIGNLVHSCDLRLNPKQADFDALIISSHTNWLSFC